MRQFSLQPNKTDTSGPLNIIAKQGHHEPKETFDLQKNSTYNTVKVI